MMFELGYYSGRIYAGIIVVIACVWTLIPTNFSFESLDWGTVLAAMIGVCGYVVDARTSRSAEIRGHQVDRANQQFEKLLVQINVGFHSLMLSLYGFLGTQYDSTEEYTSIDKAIKAIGPYWAWRDPEGLCKISVNSLEDAKPAVAVSYEIPKPLANDILKNPTGKVGMAYRTFIRYEWIPEVERIAQAIETGMHLMETIPVDKLRSLFGEEKAPFNNNWAYVPRGIFLSWWLAYSRGWTAVLHAWDNEDFSLLRPNVAFPVGIYFYVVQGQTIVGTLLKELTGQSQMHGSYGRSYLSSSSPT